MADSCPVTTRGKQQRGGNDKRRFSDEQIRRLEVMFESESKLEPRKKVEVARELGLQPRQVAIWFQNRRARWKSKHIEKEYSALLASYNNLAAEFEALKEEKHDLLIQLEKLKAKAGDEEEAGGGGGARSGSSDGEAESVKLDFDVMKNNIDVGGGGWELGMASVSASEDEAAHAAFHGGGGEEEELLRMVEAETTPDWGGLDCDDMIINQSSSQWWGFWS